MSVPSIHVAAEADTDDFRYIYRELVVQAGGTPTHVVAELIGTAESPRCALLSCNPIGGESFLHRDLTRGFDTPYPITRINAPSGWVD